jgi:hypothetical protein
LLKRPLTKADLARVLDAASKIGSDGEKASLLAQSSREIPADTAVWQAWFNAVDSINTDGEHRRALQALLKENIHDREARASSVPPAGLRTTGRRPPSSRLWRTTARTTTR